MYLEKFRLDGRNAVITGTAQGIGFACAEALAEAGAHVVIADRDATVAEVARHQLRAKGYRVDVVTVDVTDSKQLEEPRDQRPQPGPSALAA